MKTKLQFFLLLLSLLSLSGLAQAQGTAIGYQGHLNDGDLPATGLYDFTFAVFGAEDGGAAQSPTLPLNAVPVTNGWFSVELDFGVATFDGAPRWLEIAVRKSGVGDAKVLTPRTHLLPTPYSIYAGIAGSVMDSTIDVDQFYTGGVGPTPGQFLSYNGANLSWSDPEVLVGNIWSRAETVAYYNAGNVGIGTSAPAHRLSLAGGPIWTDNQWLGAMSLQNASAIGWEANPGGQRFGMGHSYGGFYLFRTASNPGTIGSPALYDFMVNDVGNVGIGTINPSCRLQVNGGWDGEQGALQLSGHRPTLRFTGDADSGNESWLLHLGGSGPGNLGFFRRTGPSAWSPVMALTTGGRQMEIYGQDALAFIGYQPFLSFYDADNNSYARARIQSAAGNLFLKPDGGHVTVEATDLWLGHPTRRGSPGRALVDLGSELHLNFASDWAKTVIGGNNVSVCTLTIRGGCDLAEPFQMSTQELPKGAVVVIDDENAGKLKLSDRAYDQRVAGIVSGANGIEPGISLYQQGAIEGGQNVALSGRVYVQADASTGAIKPGDLLTTSSMPGHAMKVADHSRSQGAILGKAMSALKEGRGMVLVLVTLQ